MDGVGQLGNRDPDETDAAIRQVPGSVPCPVAGLVLRGHWRGHRVTVVSDGPWRLPAARPEL